MSNARLIILLVVILPPALPAQQIGTVRFATSCNAAAQAEMNRSVALLHSFAFSQAVDGFSAVLQADSTCSIARWGIALSAWGNPFAAGIKPGAQLQRGLDAVNAARARPPSTDREREYVAAAAKLFDDYQTVEQRARILAYRDAMAVLSAAHPDDSEAAIFHALALAFSADPADKTYASQLQAGAILEKLQVSQPDHPGLAHYIIHSYDVSPLAPRALGAARRYAQIAPGASHALHMPSHTFTRTGDWQASINTNVAAAAAARRENSTAEELHASDYLMYAYLQTGQDHAAEQLLASLPEVIGRFDPTRPGSAAPAAAGFFAITALPARYALERGAWADAAHLEIRPATQPWIDAITRFARALGAARSGDTVAARDDLTALARLHDQLVAQHEDYWSDQVEIQRLAATAWLAWAEGRGGEALAGMRDAVQREEATEKNAITPGPLAPARELLAEMLLEMHEAPQALAEFERTLRREPNRFRSLAGAGRAALAAGDRAKAQRYYAQLLKLCAASDQPGRRELVDARKAIAPPK